MAPDAEFLDKETLDKISGAQGAEILVGIPSFNNARTIGHVVRSVQAGLVKYFPRHRAIIVNSDGGSTDGTREVVATTTYGDPRALLISHEAIEPFVVATPYSGLPGKGSAVRTILGIAERVGAKACVLVDSDLRSITPEWVELLVKPVLEGQYDYVAPMYKRHKFDGTITNSIVYPMTSALYGKKVRQPIGGDFGFSGRLASFLLARDVWNTEVARFGIDIWMTTTAIANGFKVCQSFLGAKIHDPKDPAAALSSMLYQVVSALFDLMEGYEQVWKSVEHAEEVPIFGFQYEAWLEPVHVDVDSMIEKFQLGVKELGPVWEAFISPEVLALLRELGKTSKPGFGFQDELWARAVYDFALKYHKNDMNRELLIKSLTPLYLGKVASFVLEAADYDALQVELRLDGLCRAYASEKPRLVKMWG